MEEKTCKGIQKSLTFDKSGETLSVEIHLKNVSPELKKENLSDFLDTLYQSAKDAIFQRETYLQIQLT